MAIQEGGGDENDIQTPQGVYCINSTLISINIVLKYVTQHGKRYPSGGKGNRL